MDVKKEENDKSKGPPENEFELIDWINAFLPNDHKGKYNCIGSTPGFSRAGKNQDLLLKK